MSHSAERVFFANKCWEAVSHLRLKAKLQFIFYFLFLVTQIQMLISYPMVPFTPCHVLLGVVYSHCLGSINKEMPMLSFIQRHDNTPSSLPYNPPLPTRGCLMYHASRRIYNVQAAAAAAGNLNMSTHNSIGCSTACAVSYPAVGRADLRG